MEAQSTPAILSPSDSELGNHERSVDGRATISFAGGGGGEDEGQQQQHIYLERYVMGTIFGHFYRGIQHSLPQGQHPPVNQRGEQNRRAVKCIYIDRYNARDASPNTTEDPDNEIIIKAHIEEQSTFQMALDNHIILPQRVLSNQTQTNLTHRNEKYFIILSPFANGGDLFEQMMDSHLNDSDSPLLKTYFRQILQAVQFLHSHQVFHSDLKPENVVTRNREEAFVIDFGQAKVIPEGVNDIANEGHGYGTCLYTAPEFITSRRIDWRKADVWALGVSFFMLLLKQYPPWAKQNRTGQVKKVNPHDRAFQMICRNRQLARFVRRDNIDISDMAVDLVQRMLLENVADRISINDILAHPWMRQ